MLGVMRLRIVIWTIAILLHPLMLSGEYLESDTVNAATVYENSLGAENAGKIRIRNPMGMSEDELINFIQVFKDAKFRIALKSGGVLWGKVRLVDSGIVVIEPQVLGLTKTNHLKRKLLFDEITMVQLEGRRKRNWKIPSFFIGVGVGVILGVLRVK